MPNPNDDYDDDYDDRPAPRRRPRRDESDDYDDDYDDYDDRPRRRPPPPAKSSMALVWIVLGIFAVLAVLGVLLVIGLALPAISKVRTAAARAKDSNNLKQIGLGMLSDNEVNGRGYFAPFAHDSAGRVVEAKLSHRVSLLPYVEQSALFNRFDLHSDWDSPRNQSNSNVVVATYTSPSPENTTPTNTPYRALVGGGAMFNENGKPVTFLDISDGTSNTISTASSTEEVPWAAPRELSYNPNGSLPPFGSAAYPDGANVLFADGSVKFLRKATPEPIVRALITRGRGETIGDW